MPDNHLSSSAASSLVKFNISPTNSVPATSAPRNASSSSSSSSDQASSQQHPVGQHRKLKGGSRGSHGGPSSLSALPSNTLWVECNPTRENPLRGPSADFEGHPSRLNLQTSLSEKSESDSIEYLDLVKNSKSRPTRATAAKNGENRSLGDTHIEPINAISPRVPVGISETSPLSPPHMRLPISPSFPASSSHANAMDSVTRGLPPNPLGGSLTNEYRPPRPPGGGRRPPPSESPPVVTARRRRFKLAWGSEPTAQKTMTEENEVEAEIEEEQHNAYDSSSA